MTANRPPTFPGATVPTTIEKSKITKQSHRGGGIAPSNEGSPKAPFAPGPHCATQSNTHAKTQSGRLFASQAARASQNSNRLRPSMGSFAKTAPRHNRNYGPNPPTEEIGPQMTVSRQIRNHPIPAPPRPISQNYDWLRPVRSFVRKVRPNQKKWSQTLRNKPLSRCVIAFKRKGAGVRAARIGYELA